MANFFSDLLVISRMVGAQDGSHSVWMIFAANSQEGGENRENGLTEYNSRGSIKFN